MDLNEKYNKVKLARCPRCQHEAAVRYKDRGKKVCRICFTSESILELMYLVPAHFISPEEVATLESDYADWDERDGYKQEKLQT
jgi:hypothetical protein